LGKLKVLSGKELCKILEIFDFEYIRQKGSHIIMQKKINDSTITIPAPDHKELKQGTLKSIIRKSNIDIQAFLTK
jgi:predicted RNA binding protein YcfA (HicA-like mRNA interferase family)